MDLGLDYEWTWDWTNCTVQWAGLTVPFNGLDLGLDYEWTWNWTRGWTLNGLGTGLTVPFNELD